MAIDKGNIKTSTNYDVKAQKPLDGRAVRPAKADLIKKESWSSDGSTVYVYEGMQVYVQDEKKTYYLKDLSKMFATDFSGWELMGTGAAAEVEVDTELSGSSTNPIANKTVSRALADKQERLMNGINIKTINGQNVLGRGNITIEGGGGGISEEKEVYIGSEEPPVGAKLWIDPTGTPSQPSQPSADNGIRYFIVSEDVMSTIAQGEIYTFTGSQAEEARRLLYDWENYTYIIMLRFNGSHLNADTKYGNNAYVVLAPEAQLDKDAPEPLLTVFIPVGNDAEGMFSSDLFNIWEEDGVFLAGM